jgi:hypothetical protein
VYIVLFFDIKLMKSPKVSNSNKVDETTWLLTSYGYGKSLVYSTKKLEYEKLPIVYFDNFEKLQSCFKTSNSLTNIHNYLTFNIVKQFTLNFDSMKVKTYKISKKNQITLPNNFLKYIESGQGSFVQIYIDPKVGGIVIKSQQNPIQKWRGVAKKSSKINYKQALTLLEEDRQLEDKTN